MKLRVGPVLVLAALGWFAAVLTRPATQVLMPTPDGRLKLTPCTLVFFADGGPSAEKDKQARGQRRPIVMQAPEGAGRPRLLLFYRGSGFEALGAGRHGSLDDRPRLGPDPLRSRRNDRHRDRRRRWDRQRLRSDDPVAAGLGDCRTDSECRRDLLSAGRGLRRRYDHQRLQALRDGNDQLGRRVGAEQHGGDRQSSRDRPVADRGPDRRDLTGRRRGLLFRYGHGSGDALRQRRRRPGARRSRHGHRP